MKRTIILLVGTTVAVLCLSSCTQRTCPTYSKNTISKPHAGSNTCASNKPTSYKGFNY